MHIIFFRIHQPGLATRANRDTARIVTFEPIFDMAFGTGYDDERLFRHILQYQFGERYETANYEFGKKMIFQQYTSNSPKLPLSTKIYLVVWILISLAILSIFTFTIFLVALIAGVVIFFFNLFRKGPSLARNDDSSPQVRPYEGPRPRDDDVIDI